MMKKAIFAILLLCATAGRAGAQAFEWQVDDSCLTLYQNVFAGQWDNPDSVMVDTCAPYELYPYYAKKYFYVDFDSDIFHIPSAPIDSVIVRTWEQLDTNYTDLRKRFDSLERSFGKFVLQKRDPSAANGPNSGLYFILFDSAQFIYGMTYGNLSDSGAIGDILGIENAIYLSMPVQVDSPSGVVESSSAFQTNSWPDPARTYIHIISSSYPISQVTIYNENGEKVREMLLETEAQEVDVSLVGLPPGRYFIQAGEEIFHFILGP